MSIFSKIRKEAKRFERKRLRPAVRTVKQLAPLASFIPGVGGIVGSLQSSKLGRFVTGIQSRAKPFRSVAKSFGGAKRMIPGKSMVGFSPSRSIIPRGGSPMSLLPAISGAAGRVLPGLGRVLRSTAGGIAGGAIAQGLLGGGGGGGGRRRRRRGFTNRDISQARKLVRLANEFSCPGTRTRRVKSCR